MECPVCSGSAINISSPEFNSKSFKCDECGEYDLLGNVHSLLLELESEGRKIALLRAKNNARNRSRPQIALVSFVAYSSDDLIDKLDRCDVSVSGSRSSRTTLHTENWCTVHLLRTITNSSILSYPLMIVPSDKPDLVLELKKDEPKRIGIEITEAISPYWANFQVGNEREKSDECVLVPDIEYTDERYSNEMFEHLMGRAKIPSMGNDIERNWYKAILGFIRKKSRNFNRVTDHPDCRNSSENWLLIYDNWSPAPPFSEVEKMVFELNQVLLSKSFPHPFDRVLVQSIEGIWDLTQIQFYPSSGDTSSDM